MVPHVHLTQDLAVYFHLPCKDVLGWTQCSSSEAGLQDLTTVHSVISQKAPRVMGVMVGWYNAYLSLSPPWTSFLNREGHELKKQPNHNIHQNHQFIGNLSIRTH